jgi:outer membrane protein insertion porin family
MAALRAFLLGALCALAVSSPAAAAVADYLGKTVGSVTLAIENQQTTDPALLNIVETTVGQPLSMAAVRESISHLFSLGRFEGVSVDAALEGGRVVLRYELTPIHPVTRIEFAFSAAAPGADTGAMRRALADRYGATPPLTRAADMARLVESTLAERGYLTAKATPQPRVEHAPDRATLVFAIDPGARTTIGRIDVVGRPTVGRDELLRRLGIATGAPLLRDRLNERVERYLEDRRGHGYYEARLVPTIALVDDGRAADVTLELDPGPRVRVVFTGDELPSDRRTELVPIAREASTDEDLLEDSSNRIEEYFRSQGYREAKAPHTRQETGDELVITFAVKRGPLYRVATYEISGNATISADEMAPGLKLHVGEPFADSRLDSDVSGIEALYRRRGFPAARARAAVEPQSAGSTAGFVPVTVRIVVAEGPQTIVDQVSIVGHAAVSEAALRQQIRLQPGEPYVPGQLAIDRDAILRTYQNRGYENATVEAVPQFNSDQSRALVTFRIQEGSQVFVDHVLIVGNVRTKAETIERELQFKAGDPYSLAAIIESQRRLASLGLFRRARISELRHGSETTRDLLVSIEEAPPTTIAYGVGAEGRRIADSRSETGAAAERFDIAPRALFEIGRRNLFGANRSANLFTSVSRSVRSGNQTTNPTEYRVVATFREPRLFDLPADAFVNGTLEQQHRSTFDFARRSFSANVERRFPGPYRITGTYQLQRTRVFNVKSDDPNLPLIDRTFPQFLLSSFSASLIRDTRDDPLDTRNGNYASANGQLAAQAIGSELGFVKSFFTAQMFRTVPHTRSLVFAGSARLGMATGYSTEGDLPASERFFAGGDTTVRGFAIDQLGVRHFPARASDTIDKDGFPIGGNGLVVFNAEMRVPVTGGLGLVGFLDTGNVFARVSDVVLGELRSAIGGGIRYKSPVGPLRIDLGFKLNRQTGESLTAWFVSFGQAF